MRGFVRNLLKELGQPNFSRRLYCVHYLYKKEDLKSTQNDKFFKDTFHGSFIYSKRFYRKSNVEEIFVLSFVLFELSRLKF